MLEYRDTTTGLAIPLRENDVDTDRIIPARFMKVVTFEGIGTYAFYDARFDENGKEKDHPFNDKKFKKGSIMVVNRNFGCGSSREHAPQSLQKYGIKAIIGESFAEIFAGNCTVLGIPCVTLSPGDIEELQDLIQEKPETEVTVNLEDRTVTAGDKAYKLTIKESYRNSLISGTWDSTAELLTHRNEIASTVKKLPYLNGFK